MRKILVIALTALAITTYGQDKYNYVTFNKLTEIEGTEYVMASVENSGKMLKINDKYLLFINTVSGETIQVDFPKDSYIRKIEQIKIDSLGINLLVFEAKTVDLDGKKGIDWDDPAQIFVITPDGKQKTQLTEDSFFVRNWTVNKLAGKIIVAGHYDTNNNKKYDKTDKNEIHIYDLKSLKLIAKI